MIFMQDIIVFRYGHRLERDKRTTTHCALVARAFGAKEIIYTGEEDPSVEKSVIGINNRWGGNFKISFIKNWKKALETLKEDSIIVHLTMYGLEINDFLKQFKKQITNKKDAAKRIIVVVGSQKVPTEVYQLADYNVSVTNQPHSEIAALTIVLDRLNPDYQTKEFQDKNFKNEKLKIIPTNKGKIIKES